MSHVSDFIYVISLAIIILAGIMLVKLLLGRKVQQQHSTKAESKAEQNTLDSAPDKMDISCDAHNSPIKQYYQERNVEKSSVLNFLNSYLDKGDIGERLVNSAIARGLDKHEYILHKNITLALEDGSTQIDHIIISLYGIFVIETKNMSGWIYGNKHEKKWRQVFGKKKVILFQNPIHQNYKHVKAVEKYLKIDSKKIVSMVIFTGNAELKNKQESGIFDLFETTTEIKKHKKRLFNIDELIKLSRRMDVARLPSNRDTDRRHVDHLKSKHG
ncbi:nuclease-related domain-containing protein [Neptunomonas sp.]|uniref:nuclease-related domain-containing protein n=1 Tax=Neptunomonas sp. TaxID=1971898 RepID=UPI0025DE74F9|nr:nuclease-related domain-containing protein [Neptunomonas sp.]